MPARQPYRPSRFTKIAAAIAAVGALGLIASAVFGQRAPAGLLPYEDPAALAAGEALYAGHCAVCHGADLEGAPDWQVRDAAGYLPAPPHDATGHTWHHPDTQLFMITKYGTEALVGGDYRSKMIGFGDMLSDAEILAVLAFIKSTWPERIIRRHDEINAAAVSQPQQ